MEPNMPSILNIGQCNIDGPRMESLFKHKLHARVLSADNLHDAQAILSDEPVDIVLVNRELAFDSASGIDVIDALRRAGCRAPIMLVSDHEDAQEEAMQAGAVRGFGKSQLEDPATLELIREAVAQ